MTARKVATDGQGAGDLSELDLLKALRDAIESVGKNLDRLEEKITRLEMEMDRND